MSNVRTSQICFTSNVRTSQICFMSIIYTSQICFMSNVYTSQICFMSNVCTSQVHGCQVSRQTLDSRVLKLTVYDVDRLRRHVVIGHVLYPIRGHDDGVGGGACDSKCIVSRDLEGEAVEVCAAKSCLQTNY